MHETGLHIRRKGETRWRFNARGEKVEVMPGDRVALVMVSPPGLVKRPPLQDLEAEQLHSWVRAESTTIKPGIVPTLCWPVQGGPGPH